ncbi:hypothetical protein BDR07DRAFT_1391086 [Suillus spraguei]|nr:hypothetical protein BDR07DRAFT_1391086 [Suillus spraguei]
MTDTVFCLICVRPSGHINIFTSLTTLPAVFETFQPAGGILYDLDEAIELHRAALLLRQPGYSHRHRSFNKLFNCLSDRFHQQDISSGSI